MYDSEEQPPNAFRIAHALVWLGFAIHAALTVLLWGSGLTIPFVVGLVAMGVVALAMYGHAKWSRWALSTVATWFVSIWLYSLLALPSKSTGVAHVFDLAVDAIRFGAFGAAAVLVWLSPVRSWYASRI